MHERHSMKPSTVTLHLGTEGRGLGDPVSPSPVVATSFYNQPGVISFSGNELSTDAPHFYSRWSNPTLEILEKKLAALDGGEAALCYGSGMAAVSALFLDTLKSGDHLILSNVCYAAVAELAHDSFPGFGIQVSTVDTSDLDAIRNALRPNTRLIHIETPANPILRIADITAIAAIAHAAGARLSVDSTIASPLGQQPLALGADYVVHSLTKYICGHGDALGGVIISNAEDIARLRRSSLIHLGAVLSPFSAWLILRGLETLVPRMRQHEQNAAKINEFLQSHAKVRSVLWPGSKSHPQYALAAAQMTNFSGLLSFTLKQDSAAMAARLAERLRIVSYAVSLGKTRSLIFYIPTDDIIQSSFHLRGRDEQSYRDVAGDGVFRLSAGIEDADDLIADLAQAL
jgi:cystathionine gamma-synthase